MGIKKSAIPNILVILASICLLLAQVFSYQADKSTDDLIEALDYQVKFVDLRATMNEHLLRVMLTGTEVNDSIKQAVFNEKKQLLWDMSGENVGNEYDALIWSTLNTPFFDYEKSLKNYLHEVTNLNFERAQWEDSSGEVFLIKSRYKWAKFLRNTFIVLAFILLALALLTEAKFHRD